MLSQHSQSAGALRCPSHACSSSFSLCGYVHDVGVQILQHQYSRDVQALQLDRRTRRQDHGSFTAEAANFQIPSHCKDFSQLTAVFTAGSRNSMRIWIELTSWGMSKTCLTQREESIEVSSRDGSIMRCICLAGTILTAADRSGGVTRHTRVTGGADMTDTSRRTPLLAFGLLLLLSCSFHAVAGRRLLALDGGAPIHAVHACILIYATALMHWKPWKLV